MRCAFWCAVIFLVFGSGLAKADHLLYYTGTLTGTSYEAYQDPIYGLSLRPVDYTGTATATYDIDTLKFPSFVVQTFEGPFTYDIYGIDVYYGCYGFSDCLQVFDNSDSTLKDLDFDGKHGLGLLTVFGYIDYEDEFNGTLTEVGDSSAVTPEPASFALLGTGLFGIAGVLRRRTT